MPEPKSINELNADLFQPEAPDPSVDPRAARKKAMDYLARREYGRDELIDKLKSAGFDGDIAEEAVHVLVSDGLQSDVRFASAFVQSRIGQGKGPIRIRHELRERGLDGGEVDAAIDGAGQDWFELAREVRVRKFGPGLPADFAEKARQMRFLQYRGFESGQIQAAVGSRGED